MANYDFEDRVVLITGAGSGIGEACALTFAGNGAKVVVADIDEKDGQRVVDELNGRGDVALFVKTDVSDPSAVQALVAKAVSTYGKLDCAVNNAGIGGEIAPVGEYGIPDWQKVISINLNAVFYGMRYQIPEMLKGGRGAIVNTASILGLVGFADSSAYVAAKHGIIGLTQTAAIEYSSRGVRTNAVCPGFIHTPLVEKTLDAKEQEQLVGLHPIGRLGTPQEVADLVVFLCSDEASFITGSTCMIDGGYTAR